MENYFMAAFEQLLEERIEQYIAQGMDEGEAETRAEQELDEDGELVYDRAVDNYSSAIDFAYDAYRDSSM
jgi:uncharacterized protein YoaH (UPF0181 family)